ncbi:MAG: hypothetical protein QGH57_04815 [Candidatus Thalassarchaeaceae archaeon]|nr:hypothetical protein [Candidatus Thalassarchaeaceae archaeon]
MPVEGRCRGSVSDPAIQGAEHPDDVLFAVGLSVPHGQAKQLHRLVELLPDLSVGVITDPGLPDYPPELVALAHHAARGSEPAVLDLTHGEPDEASNRLLGEVSRAMDGGPFEQADPYVDVVARRLVPVLLDDRSYLGDARTYPFSADSNGLHSL